MLMERNVALCQQSKNHRKTHFPFLSSNDNSIGNFTIGGLLFIPAASCYISIGTSLEEAVMKWKCPTSNLCEHYHFRKVWNGLRSENNTSSICPQPRLVLWKAQDMFKNTWKISNLVSHWSSLFLFLHFQPFEVIKIQTNSFTFKSTFFKYCKWQG